MSHTANKPNNKFLKSLLTLTNWKQTEHYGGKSRALSLSHSRWAVLYGDTWCRP